VAARILKRAISIIKKGKDIKMVEYTIVKYCKMCRKRFLVNRGESKRYYCNDCESKANKY